MVLWEICFDYFDRDREKGQTPFIPLETFRELMGIEADEYRTFKALNQTLIKRQSRKSTKSQTISSKPNTNVLAAKSPNSSSISPRSSSCPVQESLFPDIENLPPVALELVQAEIDRKVAQNIADQAWDFVNPEKLPPPGIYPDFLTYIAEKIEMSLHRAEVKNRSGFIIEAIRENYQDSEVQKVREVRAEKVREKELEDLTAEFKVKRDNILRQAVHNQSRTRCVRCGKNPSLHYPRTAPRTQLRFRGVPKRRNGQGRDRRHSRRRILSGTARTGC